MKIKTAEITGAALDWAVAKCELGERLLAVRPDKVAYGYGAPEDWWKIDWLYPEGDEGRQTTPLPKYSSDWGQGGPLIEREKIAPMYEPSQVYDDMHRWKAMCAMSDSDLQYGPTPLVAVMRCRVASRMGEAVDVPEELL